MSHECPDCGQLCFCNGDIDDCCNNFPEDVEHCVHYLICEKELDDEEDDYETGILNEGVEK